VILSGSGRSVRRDKVPMAPRACLRNECRRGAGDYTASHCLKGKGHPRKGLSVTQGLGGPLYGAAV
jgi:hypothetical protein